MMDKFNLNISEEEVLSLLELGNEFRDEVKEVLINFSKVITPKSDFVIYDSIKFEDNEFYIANKTFSCGKKIVKALAGSEKVAVVVVTIGGDIDLLIKKYNDEYDFIKAYWCDKLSNWVLDKLMIHSIKQIGSLYSDEGFLTTSNWGPGYCGWSIKEQKSLLSLSKAEELGIKLSSSMLMIPVKSMSGVVGIGKNVVFKKSGCGDCNLNKCAYRSLKW